MTGNLLLDSLISLGAIALMVLAAWAAFRGHPNPLDETAARERLAFDEPDFAPQRWLLDGQGRAALAESDRGEFALVSRLGADLVTRRFGPGGARVRIDGDALIVAPHDPGARPVRIEAAGAAEWARNLEHE